MNNNAQTQLLTGEQPTINPASRVNMGNLLQEWRTSKNYVEQYTRDFQLLDQLVDGVPLTKEKDTPFVGDTTLAGLVRSIPRKSLKQLPVFSARVNGTKYSLLALLCTYLLKKYAFNEDTFGKGLLSTLQLTTEQALTHGFAPVLVSSGLMYKDFGTTMRLLHHSDIGPEPGIQDHNETGYDFVDSHMTPGRVRMILRKAKNDPNTHWNVPALEKLLQNPPQPTNYSMWESTPRQNQTGENAGPTYIISTRYEVGVTNPTTIRFSPSMPDEPLYFHQSSSKWGYPRVQYLVIDPAALTPFGISRVRLASPNQNLMNIYYANIAAMLLINSAPPILKRGRFLKQVQLKRNAVWETLDPNATAELKTIDNGALSQFTQFANQFASQMQNIMGGQTPSVQAATKDAYGNTGPGVRAAQSVMEVDINQITKLLENFTRQYALSSLDAIFSEQLDREQFIIVDDETKHAMNQRVPGFVGEDNKVLVRWGWLYSKIEEWSVEIDQSISKDELDEKKRADLQDMQVVLAQNAQYLPGAAQKVGQITDTLLQEKAPLIGPMNPMGGAPGGMPQAPQAAPAAPQGPQPPGGQLV